jgi:predicted transcriptional regulator
MRDRITRNNWRMVAADQGITLVELAKRTGISRRAIYSYSSGQHKPSDAWVEAVATVLDAVREARVA